MFNEVSADSSNAIGRQNTVSGEFSTAIGFRNTVSGGGSNAIGYMANAGNASNAMGYNSSATGNASNAIGYNSSAAGADSIAMGTDSNASATNSVAIGKGATASNANSVALGSGAETAVAHKGDTAQKVTLAGTEYNYAGLASDTKGTVSVGTKDHERQIQNVAAGDITATSTDAVNGSQLYATNQAVNANKNSITNITNTIGNLTDYAVNDGSTYSADGDGTVTITQNDQNGHSIDTKTYTITDVASKTQQDINTTNIETNTKNIATNTSNIETINNTIGTTNNGTYVSSSNTIGGNINALDDAITDMDNHMNGIDRQVNKLDNRVDRVGAGAAALAALHPLDFDPDAKWDFAAGYGNYRDANAVAVGAFYRPNEDTMFSVGGSFGGGENMVNAGITLKLGGGSHVSTSKVAMAKEIKDLRNEVETLKSAILDQSVGKKLDTSKLQLFPDVPENHWAYQDVAVLAGNGILNGYPDGNFGGDRSMTRYEFASMLYRAMLNGAKLSDKMLKEFAPELERFTVDTVHQDKNGTPTVERVRVVKNS
jgi:autotransporter adhesin